MNKFMSFMLCCLFAFGLSAKETVNISAGFLFPATLNASFGYENISVFGNGYEVFGDLGNHYSNEPGKFWKNYYWGGGLLYKGRLKKYKNGMLRFRLGPEFGAANRKFFMGVEAGLEFNHVFRNGWVFSIIQKNNVNFFHGDTFRNGLLVGLKLPL